MPHHECVVSIYDEISKYYGMPMTFENVAIALATVRRQARDAYFDGKVTYDYLRDTSLVYIGEFDRKTGQMEPTEEEYYNKWNFSEFIQKDELKDIDKQVYVND